MDDLEESDLKIAKGTNNVDMLSETPESPTQQIGLNPFNNVHTRLTGPEIKKCLGSEFEMKNRNVYEYVRDKRNAPGSEFDNDSNDKLVINEEECRGNDNNDVNFERPFEGNGNKEKSQEKNRNPSGDDEWKANVREEEMEKSFETGEQNYSNETDYDKEEGELEEGELEDDEEEMKVKEEDKSPEETETKKQEPKEPEQKQRKEEKKKETTKEKDKSETKDKREREERKRKHRDEDERRKKKKKYYSSEEDENQKKFPGREKSYDFDTLLKQEMFLVNSSNPEAVYSTDASGVVNNFPSEYSQYKDGGDSFDSAGSGGGGGEEWDEKPRRRTKRKRRSSRSPSRKNEAICMFYLQGSCKRGNDCPYSHEIAPTRKMELCKFYMMDCCAKKEKCLYMHKDFPCKYYHFGMKCKAGDQCKFSHDPLQEITKNILLKHIELAPKDILGDFPRVSKHNAQTIISITEAKRKGENFEVENLESLLVLEGKGFKYLDRVLKNVRKKKDGDKKEKDKERERENKEDRERSPKRSKSREEHRDSDKDKEREKEKERDREKDRDKEKKEERERDKERYRNRDNRDRERTRERRRHRSKGEYPAHKYRGENDRLQQQQQQQQEQQQHYHQLGRREDSRERDYGRSSLDGPGTSRGIQGQFMDPNPKWYSSDEECDMNNTQAVRRNQNDSPPQTRRQRLEESSHTLPPAHGQFSIDIDVKYLKNVLSAVQNQSSQNQNFNSINSGMKEERSNNLWEQNSNRYSSTESRTSMGYMDISNDIKEVFYEEPKESLRADQFSSNLDTFLQRARSKSLSTQSNYKDDFRETNVNSRDFKFQNPLERSWSQNNSDTARDGREKSHHSMAMKRECPSGDPDKSFAAESGRYSREENSWDNKRVHDGTVPFNGLPFSSKDDLDFQDRTNNAKGDVDLRIFPGTVNRQTDKINDRIDSTSSSIYDFDYRLIDSINSSINIDDKMSTLPFKVPVHSSAKEIDASYKVHIPVVYKLVKVDIPKPDFSKIKINQDDKKIMDDPRLRKMLRRSSLESPASPRENFEASPDISIRSPTSEFKESRDPRKMAASRDPRTEGKAMVRADPRPDPRMSIRADPRSVNPRVDPRIDTRDTRMDIRDDPRMDSRDTRMDMMDPILDSDVRDSDPRFGNNQMYSNGMIDGHGFQQFLNNNLSNPILPDPRGPDPRGKPGLLGAAPGPKRVPVGLAGTINQGMGGNPFLLSQPMGGLSGPYMNDDRGDMMSGSGPPPFSQNHWGNNGGGGGRLNLNDPRLNRDLDMGS